MKITLVGKIELPEKLTTPKVTDSPKKSPDILSVEMELGKDNTLVGRRKDGKICLLHNNSNVEVKPTEVWECIVTKEFDKYCIVLPKTMLVSVEEAFQINSSKLKDSGIQVVSQIKVKHGLTRVQV